MNAPSYRPSPERLREFVETARRLKSERATAEEVVRQLLASTPVAEWPQLATREELRNSGALERLGCESRDLLEKKPQDALAIAELATTIAESLDEEMYPKVTLAQIRAGAWKDRANALRYVSRHDEAYDAITRAEKTLKVHAALVVDRAVVDLVKAMIVHELERFTEAYALLRNAEQTFSEVGDTKYLRYTRITTANVLYNNGRYAEARQMYGLLLADARSARDHESVARLQNNLGYCATHLGEYAAANIHFSEAIAGFTDLGYGIEAVRTQRGAGTLFAEKGQATKALAHLRDARSAYVKNHMIRDAGLCGLKIAEVLLSSGDVKGAQGMAKKIAQDFEEAHFSAHAVGALAALERALGADDASVESIRDVHCFIEEMPDAFLAAAQ